MSDDLTPAEQARACRVAADHLVDCGFGRCEAVRELRSFARQLDPPETVESLRAERDKVRDESKAWEDLATKWRDRSFEHRDEVRAAETMRECAETASRDMAKALNVVRAERGEAVEDVAYWQQQFRQVCDEVTALKDAAKPRVWRAGDPEPDEMTALVDRQGDSWIRGPHGWGRDWRDPRGTGRVDWRTVLHFAPLTEVLTKSVTYED